MYKDFEEFKEKIHPYFGRGNYSNNTDLLKFIIEKEEEICQICLLNEHCQHNFDFECKEAN